MELARLRPWVLALACVGGAAVWYRADLAQRMPPPGARVPPPPPIETNAPPVMHGRAATRDVTFYAVSDTHLGFVPETDEARLVKELNAAEGRPYPKSIGGNVGHPRGLVITGDLTEWGTDDEWARFAYFFGSTTTSPSEGGLTIPTYEVVGNHDNGHGPWVADQVAARHGGKPYSFDLDDVHFDALGEAPDDVALDWLERDLASYEKNVPLVVYFHLALLGPWSDNNWFAEGDYKSRLGKILKDRCVVAIIHGHHHATDHYTWNGIDVYKPGAVKHDAHTFAVFHLSGDTMTTAYWSWNADTWVWSQSKSMCGG